MRDQLFAARGGEQAHELIDLLLQQHPREALPVLMEYAQRGPIPHLRTHAVSLLAEGASGGDAVPAEFFERSLRDPLLEYWGVKGLAAASGPASFPALTAVALDGGRKLAVRAHAIRVMGLTAGQHFILGLPTDPGYWKEAALPLQAVKDWAAAGFPQGPGFAPPASSARLLDPRSDLDRAAAALDHKLARQRAERQDPVNPTNWLIPASSIDLATIQSRWSLPGLYLEFLREFSPLRVTLDTEEFPQGLGLFGAADLIAMQNGYSYDTVRRCPIPSWPPNLLVIAEHGGDPVVLDLSRIVDADAPVSMAEHGTGSWDFAAVAPSFLAFLRQLAA